MLIISIHLTSKKGGFNRGLIYISSIDETEAISFGDKLNRKNLEEMSKNIHRHSPRSEFADILVHKYHILLKLRKLYSGSSVISRVLL